MFINLQASKGPDSDMRQVDNHETLSTLSCLSQQDQLPWSKSHSEMPKNSHLKVQTFCLWHALERERENKKIKAITSRPINLPIHANKCKILLLLNLIKTSAAIILPWFRASSLSTTAEGVIMLFDEWRRKRPFLQVKNKHYLN